MKEIIKPERDFKMIKFVTRILLYISIFLIIICCFTTLITNTIDSYPINYISIMTAGFILYFSIIVIAIISIYKKIKGNLIWGAIKREVVLVVTTIISIIILGVITNYIAKK